MTSEANAVFWIVENAPFLHRYLRLDIDKLNTDLLPLVNKDDTFPALLAMIPLHVETLTNVKPKVMWSKLPLPDDDTEPIEPTEEASANGATFLSDGSGSESAPESAQEASE
jgi:hypothetical protein